RGRKTVAPGLARQLADAAGHGARLPAANRSADRDRALRRRSRRRWVERGRGRASAVAWNKESCVTDIVDAHHHIWRQADLAWLSGPMQPRIFGPYEPIRRDYPIQEYLDDLKGTGVTRSVYVQTNWPPGKAVDEVRWVQSVADQSGWPHAIVGSADLMDD